MTGIAILLVREPRPAPPPYTGPDCVMARCPSKACKQTPEHAPLCWDHVDVWNAQHFGPLSFVALLCPDCGDWSTTRRVEPHSIVRRDDCSIAGYRCESCTEARR